MWPFDLRKKKQEDKKRKKRILLSKTLCAFGGALICATIIIPITLTKCNNKTAPPYPPTVVTPESAYFTATVIKDTLKSDGEGEAIVKINLYNDADFSKLSFDDNGTGFTATKNSSSLSFDIIGHESVGDKIINIISNEYGSHEVGIHVDQSDSTINELVNVPVNEAIYRIENDVIQGFSTNFLNASRNKTAAREYLALECNGVPIDSKFCMDLHGQKITGERYAFSPSGVGNENINNILPLFIELNFSNTKWQWRDNYSGNYTLYGGDFSNVTTLELQSANFAIDDNNKPTSGDVYTANGTFNSVRFTSLETLYLSGAIFATSNMTSGDVYTANETFSYTHNHSFNFPSLETLDFSGAVFATTNMTTNGDVFTAYSTFSILVARIPLDRFPKLKNLILYKTIFAAVNMTLNGDVRTACQTFVKDKLQKIQILNFYKTTFTTANMTTSGDAYAADSTFAFVDFSSLKILDLWNCKLSNNDNIIDSSCFRSIRNKPWTTSNQLQLISNEDNYWETTGANQLDNWFNDSSGNRCWTFN